MLPCDSVTRQPSATVDQPKPRFLPPNRQMPQDADLQRQFRHFAAVVAEVPSIDSDALIGQRHVPSPPSNDAPFQADCRRGARGRGEGEGESPCAQRCCSTNNCARQAPSSGLPATFSPDLGGEGTCRVRESHAAVGLVAQGGAAQLRIRQKEFTGKSPLLAAIRRPKRQLRFSAAGSGQCGNRFPDRRPPGHTLC